MHFGFSSWRCSCNPGRPLVGADPGNACSSRQVDVLVSQGQTVADALRATGVAEVANTDGAGNLVAFDQLSFIASRPNPTTPLPHSFSDS